MLRLFFGDHIKFNNKNQYLLIIKPLLKHNRFKDIIIKNYSAKKIYGIMHFRTSELKINTTIMKTVYASLAILFSLNLMQASAQTDKVTTQKLVDSKNFVFNAKRANPMSEASLNQIMGPNSMNNLLDLSNGRYQLQVTKDSIIADLPFFGRSYSAPMSPDKTGTKFTSKEFKYSTTKKRKNWIITIEPKDIQDSQKLIITVSESGSATLNVNNYNRQSISFDGSISEIETANRN